MMSEKKYKLFTCCQIVPGYKSSLIYDIQRSQTHRITNEFATVLQKSYFYASEIETIFHLLLEKDFIFELVNDELVNCFPPIDFSFKSPHFISNCIIEDTELTNNVTALLSKIGVRYFVLIVDSVSYSSIKHFLSHIQAELIYRVQIVVSNFNISLNLNKIEVLLQNQNIIESISFVYPHFKPNTKYFHWIKNITKKKQSFRLNLKLYSESKSYHNYFNKKIYIDKEGNIKNGIFSHQFFGNIKNFDSPDMLIKHLTESNFTYIWSVHKDKCDVCKDCEFRYMCVDNRLPYKRNENEWYHKQECNYNPYISRWQDEEGYQSLSECGVISNEKDFSIDHERIVAINEAIWGKE